MRIASLATMAFVAVLGAAPCLLADGPAQPVVISSVGPKAMRVLVAGFTAGFVFPCSSFSNTQLFEGKLEPGQQVARGTADSCICVAHTYDDFPDANWSMGQVACRPMICTRFGRAKRCWPNPDPTIRVAISSARP
jgi:hypothetical protein